MINTQKIKIKRFKVVKASLTGERLCITKDFKAVLEWFSIVLA